MNSAEQSALIEKAKTWFKETMFSKHIANTLKLANPKEFDANPLLAPYLAVFLTGELTPESVARVLTLPRVLGSSINTSFGTNMQKFISDVLSDAFGSMTTGIDIEFIDCIDGRKKYCQVKLGPNTINKDDIATIDGHFKAAKNLGRTNNVRVAVDDLVVGLVYGEESQLNNFYRALRDKHQYTVLVGKDFWHRLTGAEDFFERLIQGITEVALEANGKEMIESVIAELAKTDLARGLSGVK